MDNHSKLSHDGEIASQRKHPVITITFLYSDGRTVAIKRIHNKTFSLSKIIRQEVKQVR